MFNQDSKTPPGDSAALVVVVPQAGPAERGHVGKFKALLKW